MHDMPSVLSRYRDTITDELKSFFDSRGFPLYDLMRYHMGWADENGMSVTNNTGKMFRPALCLLTCESVRGDLNAALPAAAALELIHNFSLIHDDIQDDDRERRHRPTVWSLWGKAQAINAGTAMKILANQFIIKLKERSWPWEKIFRIQTLLDEASLSLIEGQFQDIDFENRIDVKTSQYLDMIKMKTGALITCSIQVGATIGTDDEEKIGLWKEVGGNLGMAFQIKDDILGIWGNKTDTGKPIGSDIRKKKKTYPIIFALEKGGNGLKVELAELYKQPSPGDADVDSIISHLDELDVNFEADQLVQKYCAGAEKVLSQLKISPSPHHDWEEILSFLVKRDY